MIVDEGEVVAVEAFVATVVEHEVGEPSSPLTEPTTTNRKQQSW
jgi:hypothetical protein